MEERKRYPVEFRGGQWWSVVPMLIFLVFCVVYFVGYKVFDMNALAVGGFLGLLIGALFCKTYGAYWDAVLRGIGSSTSVSIVVILLVIGMFTKLMAISGVSQGFVWMAHMVGMPGSIFTAFTFLAACLITTATGSSIGTLTTVFPILYPAGILLGSHPAILAGAILSGAIFGDNLAPISDVTIASTTNQRFRTKEGYADIAGTVGYRLKYALIAGGIALVLFAVFGGGSGAVMEGADEILQANMDPKGLIMLIPVAVLLFVSIRTRDIFKAVTAGLVSGIAVGLLSGTFGPSDILGVENGAATGFIYNGFTGMIGICLFCMALFGAMGVLNESGTMERMIQGICNSRFARTARGAELLIGLGEIDVIKSERKSTIQTEPVVRSRNIVETQGFCYNGGEHLTIEKEAGAYAHQLSAAMGHPKGARHEERGLAAGRRSYHQHDRQHGKGRAYQHENAAAYLRDAELRYCRCDCFGAGRKPHGHRASLTRSGQQ